MYDEDLDSLKEIIDELEGENLGANFGPISLTNEIKAHFYIAKVMTAF